MILYNINESQKWEGYSVRPIVAKNMAFFFPRKLQGTEGMGVNINHYDTKHGLRGKNNV